MKRAKGTSSPHPGAKHAAVEGLLSSSNPKFLNIPRLLPSPPRPHQVQSPARKFNLRKAAVASTETNFIPIQCPTGLFILATCSPAGTWQRTIHANAANEKPGSPQGLRCRRPTHLGWGGSKAGLGKLCSRTGPTAGLPQA